jgi:pimeloyl-ACP methyl ester carboxylesterase
MKTIILPGFSPHNKEWAEDIKKDLKLSHDVLVHEWRHWKNSLSLSTSLSLSYELNKIREEVGEDEFNIIGKSVGARMAIRVITELREKVKKVIICGVASISPDSQKAYLKALTTFPPDKIIVFQNTNDPFVPYLEVKIFIESINPKIKVIEKPRSDHHYPYPAEFQKFLI